MKTFDKYLEKHDELIKELGGYFAVKRRFNLQQIYFRLNFRAKRGEEHLDMVRGELLLHFLYPVDFYTETGLSRLRIPPHSCIEYKERIVSDTVLESGLFRLLALDLSEFKLFSEPITLWEWLRRTDYRCVHYDNWEG